ncbi:hypothetical protein [Parasphingorhabdus pacifica]
MREMLARKRGWRVLSALPLALLGLFLVQAVLLPAHGLPAHDAVMSAASTSSLGEHSAQTPPVPHGEAGHEHGGHGHGPADGGPVCHVGPHYADVAVNRLADDEFSELALGVLVLATGLLAVSLLLPRPPSSCWRWSSRPHWRPAGAALLAHVCIART